MRITYICVSFAFDGFKFYPYSNEKVGKYRKMEIYICRHGKTNWNIEKRKQGHKDIPLSKEGIIQAKKMADVLCNMNGIVYSSPLMRAYKTAEIIFPNKKIHTDNRIKEISFGILEGLTEKEILNKYGNIYNDFCKKPFEIKIPNGETYIDVYKRVNSFIDEIYNEEKNIFIVAHEDVNKIIITKLLNFDLKKAIDIKQPNNIIYKISNANIKHINIDEPKYEIKGFYREV